MKGFIITSILSIILMILLFVNWSFVNSVTNTMLEFIQNVSTTPSPENAKAIDKIEEYWESKASLMKLSANHKDIDEIENLIDIIKEANECEDALLLAINLQSLKNAIKNITQSEKVNAQSILKMTRLGESFLYFGFCEKDYSSNRKKNHSCQAKKLITYIKCYK